MVKLLLAVSTPPVLQPEMAVPAQTPLEQISPVVQALPSLQGDVLGVCAQLPVDASQVSVVQMFPSSQFLMVPAHTPPEQASPVVQRLPSLQGDVLGVCPQLPVAVSQESVVQIFPSLQLLIDPTQTPPKQVSFRVQALPSVQGVPSGSPAHSPHPGMGAYTQPPEAATQVSVVHKLLSLQTLAA
jgi:hypothetical protein